MNSFIRLLYTALVAIAVAVFVGVGIYSLYQPPKSPDYEDYYSNSYDYNTDDYKQADRAYDNAHDAYDEKQNDYQRNVTIILLPIIVVVVGLGIFYFNRAGIIGEGLTLGGVFLSVYAIITASIAETPALRFMAVTLLLAAVLLTAHYKFRSEKS